MTMNDASSGNIGIQKTLAMNSNDIEDTNTIFFNGSTTHFPDAAEVAIYSSSAGELGYDVATGKFHSFLVGGFERYRLSNTEFNLLNNKLSNPNPTTITTFATVTAVAGDFVWIIDATDGLNKKADVNDFLGGASPLTTKGDLFGFSTVDARIPVGTNGQVLMANSVPALGLEWVTLDASDISDFDTEVSNNASVVANTAKVSNATHTGDVTGATALTLQSVSITGQTLVTAVSGDFVLISDTSDSGNLKKVNASDFLGGSGDMVLASAQTNTGIKTFLDTTMKLRNVANTFDAYFVNTVTADRIYTLPDQAGTVALTSDLTGFFDTAGNGLTSSGSTVNVVGTAGRISVSADAINIDTAYVGQTSIVTLGTVTTGVWNGTAITYANLSFSADIVNADISASAAIAYSKLNLATSIVNTDIASGADIAVNKLADGNAGQYLRTDSAGTAVEWADDIFTINFVIDGGGATITTGIKGHVVVDFDCEVIEWALVANASGSIVVDVNRATYANYPTTATLSATEKPTITTSTKGEDRTLTTWSAISAGDVLEFEVDSITTCQRVTVALKCRKTG
jgi:hypothetical protein